MPFVGMQSLIRITSVAPGIRSDASAAACSTWPMSVARPSGRRSTRSTTSSTSASTPSGLISLSSSSKAITA